MNSLEDKQNMFSKRPFCEFNAQSEFLKCFMNVLLSKSHDRLKDEVVQILWKICSVDKFTLIFTQVRERERKRKREKEKEREEKREREERKRERRERKREREREREKERVIIIHKTKQNN